MSRHEARTKRYKIKIVFSNIDKFETEINDLLNREKAKIMSAGLHEESQNFWAVMLLETKI